MSDDEKQTAKDEEASRAVSLGLGSEQELGFLQAADGHGWPDEHVKAINDQLQANVPASKGK